jgi:hypothetical protein
MSPNTRIARQNSAPRGFAVEVREAEIELPIVRDYGRQGPFHAVTIELPTLHTGYRRRRVAVGLQILVLVKESIGSQLHSSVKQSSFVTDLYEIDVSASKWPVHGYPALRL